MADSRVNRKVFDAADMSIASVTGSDIDCEGLELLGFQFSWTGTPTGTLTFEASNDFDRQRPTLATWTAISPDAAVTNPVGGAGATLARFSLFAFKNLRPVYTRISGSGALTCWVMAKGA